MMYALIYMVFLISRNYVLLLFITLASWGIYFTNTQLSISLMQFFKLMGFYFFGAFLFTTYQIWNKAAVKQVATLSCCLLLGATANTSLAKYCFHLCVPFVSIVLATTQTPFLKNFGKYGDFSFGLYLYAFPIQQLLISYSNNNIHPLTLTVLATLLTTGASVASWYLVEKPALSYR